MEPAHYGAGIREPAHITPGIREPAHPQLVDRSGDQGTDDGVSLIAPRFGNSVA
jgi:hypothetical protein